MTEKETEAETEIWRKRRRQTEIQTDRKKN